MIFPLSKHARETPTPPFFRCPRRSRPVRRRRATCRYARYPSRSSPCARHRHAAQIVKNPDGTAALWLGEIDDLWRMGEPRGTGGPWKNSTVTANTATAQFTYGPAQAGHRSPNKRNE